MVKRKDIEDVENNNKSINKNKTKKELFLELAQPNKIGKSRWVSTSEFTGHYKSLKLGNGFSWGRKSSSLAKEYIIETKRDKNKIVSIRLNGFNTYHTFNNNIRSDIRKALENQPCVMLGVNGDSENTKIEIDHKEGTKDNKRISNIKTQKLEDFQPLCKAANDAKRQICKDCIKTNKRYDAKTIPGNPISYYKGNDKLDESGCVGCYQYDPVEYRKTILDLAKNNKL